MRCTEEPARLTPEVECTAEVEADGRPREVACTASGDNFRSAYTAPPEEGKAVTMTARVAPGKEGTGSAAGGRSSQEASFAKEAEAWGGHEGHTEAPCARTQQLSLGSPEVGHERHLDSVRLDDAFPAASSWI